MSSEKKMNLANANFGAKGWAYCIYMFFICYLNTSMNSGWQNCLSYWETTYGWDVTTLLSLVSVAQFIGIAACFITGRMGLYIEPHFRIHLVPEEKRNCNGNCYYWCSAGCRYRI